VLIARFNDVQTEAIWATEIGKQDKTPDGRGIRQGISSRLSTILLSQGVRRSIGTYFDYNGCDHGGLLREATAIRTLRARTCLRRVCNLIRQSIAEFSDVRNGSRTRIF